MKSRENKPNFVQPKDPADARVWFYYNGHELHFYVKPREREDEKPISFRVQLGRIFKSGNKRGQKSPLHVSYKESK